ncbi:MAG: hypothetical protein ACP5RT_02390 [Candidatus Micrarchaeia archaeon]
MNCELVHIFVYVVDEKLPINKIKEILKKPEEFSKYEYKAPSPEEVPTFSVPYIFNLRGGDINIGGHSLKARTQVAIYETGAISIRVRIPLENAEIKDLSDITFQKEAKEGVSILLQKAKNNIESSLSKIMSIKFNESNETYKFYYIHGNSSFLLKSYKKQIAGLIVDEKDADILSDRYVEEVLSNSISYSQNDIFFVGWEGSVMIDTQSLYDYEIIISEIANIQLLKLRLYRKRVSEMQSSTSDAISKIMGVGIIKRMFGMEAAKLNRMLSSFYDNAMETINTTNNIAFGLGEWYLSKLYALFANVFKIKELSQIVEDDMKIISKRQEFVVEQLRAGQTDALEIIMIVLIVLEILLEIIFIKKF